jgi:AraC-like DNA-binding protein
VATANYSFDEWSVVLNEVFLPMDLSGIDPRSFSATMRSKTVSGIRIMDVAAGPHVATRRDHNLTTDDLRMFCIALQLEGTSSIAQDGALSVLHPGDFAIYDSTRPFERRFEAQYRCLTIQFPHDMISLPAHTLARLTATRFAPDEGLGIVVSPYLVEVARNLGDLHGWYGLLVAHTMIDLVSAALGEKLALGGIGHPEGHTEVFLAACDHITRNLGDPQLNPESIAVECFISVRQLHKIFHAERTTVSGWIRQRRIEQCRRQLADPRESERSVGEIAARFGIHDAAHFSRLFRAAFGVSPREYRRLQLEEAR